jgi:hypothetical protein
MTTPAGVLAEREISPLELFTIPIAAVLPALAALGLVAVTLATLATYAPRPPLHALGVKAAYTPYE